VAKARGFCPGHYSVVRYRADLQHLLPKEARAERCLAPECGNPQYAGGLCLSHKERFDREGEAWEKRTDITLPAPPTIGARIFLERIRQGLTTRELAERVGVSHQRVHQIENSDILHLHNVKTYADALGVSVDALLEGVPLANTPFKLERKPGRPRGTGLKQRIERLEAALLEQNGRGMGGGTGEVPVE
jgi:transcriptional regulator with XRE-family HTH domain